MNGVAMADGPGSAHQLDELVDAMAALTGVLEAEPPEAEVLDTICTEAVRAVPGADIASITVIHAGEATTAAASDERAVLIDRAQYDAGDGPCLRAAETGEIVRLSLPLADALWPEFAAVAKQHRIGSYLAAPLRVDEGLACALNLFGFGTHGFAETDSQLLRVYTTVVGFGLRTTRRYQQARELAAQLGTAMRTRAVIEQAKGILMAVHRISDEEAVQRLITESQHTNTKLREVAQRFVADIVGE